MTGQTTWLDQARDAHHRGDVAAETAALEAAIRADRGNLPALLAMAELKRRLADDRAAGSYYRLALGTAAQARSVPPSLHPGLQRAEQFLADTDRAFADHLLGQLRHAGVDAGTATPRVAEALRMLAGEQPLYLQQPNMFYFPGLAQRPFFERSDFDWAEAVEAATDAIRAELLAMVGGASDPFGPYVTAAPGRPPPNNPLLDKPDWGAAWLWKDGAVADGMAALCPATLAALELAPQPVIPGRAPLALFSRLTPGTHIQPHHGMLNTRLICHLPLIVPDGCGLRVGAETRSWREGELLIFDDSFEHEAWNRGTSDRTILLFEIWRPDIDADEREQLTRIFAAIDTYGEQ
ncbi:aspartyl/asparaginyl beta-hydroxylase domain-containing protein [Sphingopyxis sp.]|uniref:aspartyl/asparaginyl beta-hydroxylase domain-containing protein n=1 Tax=Sphingopyxis sp. TaxID=1908224 RepID=UPI002D78F3EA|nr:aspartyl/asparaginyl beta-hydroxylase domain-containing protein [Sphingopyxis sp.]HET6525950.1 aspartyl/asparaginyl beta-hydroxylase domain-containing protein [Sphingopyxis sp.]